MQPLVAKSLVRPGELCLIVFHDGIQAVIDTSDHLIFGNNRNLARREKVLRNCGAPEPDASKPAKVLRSSRYAHSFCTLLLCHALPLIHDDDVVAMIRLDVQPFTSHFTHPAGYPTGYDAAGNPVRSHHLSLEFRFHYSASHSNAVVIIPFEQAACSTSRRTTRPRPLADRRAASRPGAGGVRRRGWGRHHLA